MFALDDGRTLDRCPMACEESKYLSLAGTHLHLFQKGMINLNELSMDWLEALIILDNNTVKPQPKIVIEMQG